LARIDQVWPFAHVPLMSGDSDQAEQDMVGRVSSINDLLAN